MSILPNATHIHTLYCLHWPFVSTHSRNGLCYYYPHLCPISTHFTSWSALVIFQTSTEEKCCDSDHQRIDIKNVYMAHLKVGSAILQKDSWLLRLIASSSNTDEKWTKWLGASSRWHSCWEWDSTVDYLRATNPKRWYLSTWEHERHLLCCAFPIYVSTDDPGLIHNNQLSPVRLTSAFIKI